MDLYATDTSTYLWLLAYLFMKEITQRNLRPLTRPSFLLSIVDCYSVLEPGQGVPAFFQTASKTSHPKPSQETNNYWPMLTEPPLALLSTAQPYVINHRLLLRFRNRTAPQAFPIPQVRHFTRKESGFVVHGTAVRTRSYNVLSPFP